MSEMTNYLEDALVNHVFRNTALTSPTTVYVALFTAAPGEAGGGTEVSDGSYARQAITFAAPSNGTISNTGTITFPTATGSWGTVTDFAILDAASGGNMLMYSPLDASKTVGNGDTATFAGSALTVTFA